MRLDEILREDVLLTPDRLATLAATPLPRDADGWVRFQGPGGCAFDWNSPERCDLEPCDMISVSLRVAAPDWRLSAAIALESHEPDSDRHNRYHVATPGPRTVQGEFRFDLPYENFHMDGLPGGWKDIRRFTLSAALPEGGSVAFGPVYLLQRRRAAGPRITDEELFREELDLDRPGLEAVKRCVAHGDLEAAGRELLAYYAARRSVVHDYGNRPPRRSGLAGRAALEFMDGVFHGQRFGDPIDWRINPNGYLEWRHAFNRHYCLGALYQAWKNTGDGRYLSRLDDALSRWLAVSPEPVGMNDGGGDPAWETLSVSCRVNWSWLDIFFGAARAPELRPRTRLDMLKSLIAHAEHLVRWEGVGNNWIIVESQAVANCGILFPELRRSARWRDVGLQRILREMRRQVWPDGVESEVSASYHWMTGQAFGELLRLARANGIALPPGYAETVERMAEYHLFLARPDGTLPSFNDSGGADGRAGPALTFGAEQFGRKDMLWLATNREQGAPPDHASHAFLDAGVYVMRSDWSEYANWLAFRGGNIGASHLHEDRLGFDLAACGSPVLVDPGAANYKPDELRAWSCATAAHNTATVDGLGQCRRDLPWEQRTASVREVNFWRSSPERDIAAARYTGPYGDRREVADVAHHREIHFIKPNFWALIDAFVGGRPHTANLLFHFMPMDVRVGHDPLVIHTRRLGRPNLEILPVQWPAEARLITSCGSIQPTQGWVALGGEWAPAPCVQADVPFHGSLVLATLLVPLPSGLASGFHCEAASDSRWRVSTPHGEYEIILERGSFDPAEARVTPLARVVAA